MDNYLLPSLKNYFDEILMIEGNVFLLNLLVNSKVVEMLSSAMNRDFFNATLTTYRDISKAVKRDSLYIADGGYFVNVENLENQSQIILNKNNSFAVAQSCEVLETFMLSIISEFLFKEQRLLKLVTKPQISLSSVNEIRNHLRLNRGKDNKELFKILRKSSSNFQKFERDNCLQINIFEWYNLIMKVRHIIVHNRQTIPNDLQDYLKKHKANTIFNSQFGTRQIDGKECIYIEKDKTSDIINILNSIAFIIYKSLSLEKGLPINTPYYDSK